MTERARQCSAHTSAGRPCRAAAIRGGTVCRVHGGSAPQTRDAARRRDAIAKARGEMERLGIPIDIDPINALLGAVREAAGNVEFLRARVQQLEEVFGANHLGDETARVVVQLYNEERDRLARTAKLAIDAGVETQLVRIEQQKAQAIVAAVEAIIESPDLGLDPERRQRAYTVAARELRALEALVFDDTESPKPLRLKLVSDDPGEDTDG